MDKYNFRSILLLILTNLWMDYIFILSIGMNQMVQVIALLKTKISMSRNGMMLLRRLVFQKMCMTMMIHSLRLFSQTVLFQGSRHMIQCLIIVRMARMSYLSLTRSLDQIMLYRRLHDVIIEIPASPWILASRGPTSKRVHIISCGLFFYRGWKLFSNLS